MTCDLPIGTFIRYRYRGEWCYATISRVIAGECAGELCHMLLGEDQIPSGSTIHTCVWKKNNIESRKKFIKL